MREKEIASAFRRSCIVIARLDRAIQYPSLWLLDRPVEPGDDSIGAIRLWQPDYASSQLIARRRVMPRPSGSMP